jgi:AcrR family transcriptional regulator
MGEQVRSRNPRGEGARLRATLLDAAEALLADGGEQALSMRAIAHRAGVTPPAIYLHFADKDDLVHTLVAGRFASLGAAIAAATDDVDDPAEALRAGCLAYCRWGVRQPGAYAVLFTAPRRSAFDADTSAVARPGSGDDHAPAPGAAGATVFGELAGAIATCQDAGVARDGDTHRMATAVWAGLHGLVLLRAARPGFAWPDLESLVDEVLAGVLLTAPRTRVR